MVSTHSTTSTASSSLTTTNTTTFNPAARSASQHEIYHPSTPLPPSKPNNEFTRKPEGALRQWVWRWRMWVEATFVLSMLEPWEKIMLVSIWIVISVFFTFTLVTYLPPHLTLMKRRAMYYLVGQEGDERLLWQWVSSFAAAHGGAGVGGLGKEL